MKNINKNLIVYALGILAILALGLIMVPKITNAQNTQNNFSSNGYTGSTSVMWCSKCPKTTVSPDYYAPEINNYNYLMIKFFNVHHLA